MHMKRLLHLTVLACASIPLALGGTSFAQQSQKAVQFKVVGSWSNLNPYKNFEAPFWNEALPKASAGAIAGDIKPVSDLGLKGFEVMRLLKLGVFDFAFGAIGYVASDSPLMEGVDLSSMSQDVKTTWEITKVYRPQLEQIFEKTFNAKLLMMYAYSSNMIFCRNPVRSVNDLKGKKIRVYSTTLGDLVEGFGATAVTIPVAEVVPAIQRGVVDCSITATITAYGSKLYEVTPHVFGLRVGWGMSFGAINLNTWNKLDEKTRTLLVEQTRDLERRMWEDGTAVDEDVGVKCMTQGPCPIGKPGNATLVNPSASDQEARRAVLKSHVLKRWVDRCGKGCVEPWNSSIGNVIDMRI